MLDAGVAWEIQDNLTMFLELLLRKDLREEICRVCHAGDVVHNHQAGAAQLAHLEQLPIDVP